MEKRIRVGVDVGGTFTDFVLVDEHRDLIYTGTPAGVGPVVAGDVLHGEIDGLDPVDLTIGRAE